MQISLTVVTKWGADQTRVCTEKNKMAPKFEYCANFGEQFLRYYKHLDGNILGTI